jgi:hypothetical protein
MMQDKPAHALQQEFKELVSSKRFAELAKLIARTETKPADYVARMGYKKYMEEPHGGKKVKLFYIMKLKELTGVDPDKAIVKEACEIALDMDSPDVLESFMKRVGLGSSIFREMSSSVQKVFTEYVDAGKFVDISKLMELTGSRPHDSVIHKGYEKYLEEGKFISFSGLKKRTGVKPDPEMIQEMYGHYHFNYIKNKRNEEGQVWVERMKKLRRLSKIDPEAFQIPEEDESS